jgi:hypothetical protein
MAQTFELPDVRNPRADLLARTTAGDLRQVELQLNNDAAMPFRMLDSYVSSATRHECTILNLREMNGADLLASDDRTDNEWALLTKSDPERVFRVVLAKLRTLSGDEQQKAASTSPSCANASKSALAQAKLAAASPEILEAWSLQLDDNPTLEILLAE